MMDDIDRLKLKSTIRDAAFWVAVLPLIASLHPEARSFLADRWELVLVLLGYLAHNGYLRGKVVAGASDLMVQKQPLVLHPEAYGEIHEEAPDGE